MLNFVFFEFGEEFPSNGVPVDVRDVGELERCQSGRAVSNRCLGALAASMRDVVRRVVIFA